MNPKTQQEELEALLKERLLQLPKVVQQAIASSDLEKHLRELADTHKLHLDQWQTLQNEVMLALLGFQPAEDLGKNIKDHIVVPSETANALAEDISRIVFQPIREELERELEHPDAKTAEVSGVEGMRTQVLNDQTAASVLATPVVQPATPPAPSPEGKVVRAPVSESYKAGETSVARKSVHDDPYREPPA